MPTYIYADFLFADKVNTYCHRVTSQWPHYWNCAHLSSSFKEFSLQHCLPTLDYLHWPAYQLASVTTAFDCRMHRIWHTSHTTAMGSRRPTSPTTLAHWRTTPVWRCNDICGGVCYVLSTCFVSLMWSTGKLLVPPGLEPGTLRVWSVRDNHYTTGPDSTVHPWIVASHSPKYVPSPVDYPTILTDK